jgi:dTDP-glucose 4,6-dehydratase
MARLLVTGGAGFVGSNLVHYWAKHYPKDSIAVLDKLTYAGDRRRLEGVKYEFYQNDLGKASDVLEVFNDFKPTIVANLGAETHVDRSIIDPESFIRPNVTGVVNVLNSVRLRPCHLIHMSTDEVLRHRDPTCIDDHYGLVPAPVSSKSTWTFHRPTEDNCEFFPQNPYSASKMAAESMVFAYRNTFKMPVTIIRATNMYGPRQYPEKFLALAITSLLEGKKVPVYGDGKYWRDYLYVEDFCKAFDFISSQRQGSDWHVSAQNERMNIDVLKLLLKIMGKDESYISYVGDRKGHDKSYSLSSAKLRALGWRPEVNINEGLQRTIEYFKELK